MTSRSTVTRRSLWLPETSLADQKTPPSGIVTLNVTPEHYLNYRDATGVIGVNNIGSIDVAAKAGEFLPDKSLVYFDVIQGLWYLQDTDSSPIRMSNPRGICNYRNGIQALETGLVSIGGVVGGYTGIVVGAPVYASTIAGGFTQVKPLLSVGGSQIAIALIGYGASTTSILIAPDPGIVYQKRVSLTSLGTTTLTHHSDPQTRTREPLVYVSSNVTALAQTYAASNQDSNLSLRGPSGAGGTTTINSNGTQYTLIGGLVAGNRRIAQSFQVAAGRLSSFAITFGPNVGVLSGATLSWSVHPDTSGNPDTTSILASGTYTFTPNAVNTVNLVNGPVMQAGVTYWVMLQSSTVLLGNYFQAAYNSTGGYASGVLKNDDSVLGLFGNNWGTSIYGAGADLRMTVTTSAIPASDRLAQGFQLQAGASIDNIKLYLNKVGTPTGTLTLSVYNDSGGSPGTLITNGTSNTVAASSLSTGYTLITFTFANPPACLANTQYHAVLSTTDSASASNYVQWGIDQSFPTYAYGETKVELSSVWSSLAPVGDAVFELYSVTAMLTEQFLMARFTASVLAEAFGWQSGQSNANTDTITSFINRTNATVIDCTVSVRIF